jgi:type VI secretion system protein ImpF
MPPNNTPQRLMPSILDRLIDPLSMGTTSSPGYSEKQMLDAVRTDLEELLNTRQTQTRIPPEYVELLDSILVYGLPDLVSFNPASVKDRAELARIVATVVDRFEPRLRKVRVKMVVGGSEHESRSARFHIDASLNVDPSPEVGFETVVELTTGRASVMTEGNT